MFRNNKVAWLFVLPALTFLLVFKIWPIGVSVIESLTMTSFTGTKSFVGFENYEYLFKHDPVFWKSFSVTLFYSIIGKSSDCLELIDNGAASEFQSLLHQVL